MAPKKKQAVPAADAEITDDSGETSSTQLPLSSCTFVIAGRFKSVVSGDIKSDIEKAGGRVVASISKNVTHVVVPAASYPPCMKTGRAKESNIPIVHSKFISDSILKKAKQPEDNYKADLQLGDENESAESEQEEEDGASPSSSKKRKANSSEPSSSSSTPRKKSKAASRTPDPEQARIRTVVKKGKVPVDEYCKFQSTHHVLCEGSMAFDFMLNQTDIAKNANKFYIAQVLEPDKSCSSYMVLTRYGRVGEQGVVNPIVGGGKDAAIAKFKSTFKSKTGIDWSLRDSTPSKSGKYTYIARNYEDSDDGNDIEDDESNEEDPDGDGSVSPKKQRKADSPPVDSKLDQTVQQLANLIFSDAIMQQTLSEMQYDAQKLPLGKLTRQTIEAGYAKLSEIDKLLDQAGGIKGNDPQVVQLTSAYYTLIPHAFPRNQVPSLINTKALIKREAEIIDSLRQMADSLRFTKKGGKEGDTDESGVKKHPLDSMVDRLGLKTMEPVGRDSKEYKVLESYCLDTRGDTHSHFQYEVTDIFRVEREGDEEKFEKYRTIEPDNRQLLWHGSRVSNFGGILGQGLRIAPPEAPVSGYMFGKGIYLANMSSKSIQYCNATSSNGNGLLLLCEAQLGDQLDLHEAEYSADIAVKDQKKHSTHGLGQMAPSSHKDAATLLGRDDLAGVKLPQGRIEKSNDQKRYLMYDEHIVYDESQIRVRYLLRVNVKMNYENW
ncbi:unnamed protein product [Sympodiomycopsis kandeliae]